MATSPSTTIKTRMPSEVAEEAHQPGDHQESNTIATTGSGNNYVALSLDEALRASQQQRMEMRQIELIYRAEGNANLVLALPQFKKVLRLPKAAPKTHEEADTGRSVPEPGPGPEPASQSTSGSVVNQNAKAAVGSPTMAEFARYIEVIRRLVGHEFVLDVAVVSIDDVTDRRWINDTIRPHRPAHRLAKEFCGQFGLLLPDATQLVAARDTTPVCSPPVAPPLCGDTYAIEIKPKQGWLLPNNKLTALCHADGGPLKDSHDESASEPKECVRLTGLYCRYCAMQYAKIRNGKISSISSYCPIDLFSREPHKMTRALNALFACPQNNLRVFRNGVCVYGGDDANMAATSHTIIDDVFGKESLPLVREILIACLLRDYSGHLETTANSNCVLSKILSLQLLAMRNYDAMMDSGFAQHTAKSYQILRSLLTKLNSGLEERMLSEGEQYLLGATAMDCSIMVAFQEIPRELGAHAKSPYVIAIPSAKRFYASKVAILDLDPKPDSHFHKYLKQTEEAYRCARLN